MVKAKTDAALPNRPIAQPARLELAFKKLANIQITTDLKDVKQSNQKSLIINPTVETEMVLTAKPAMLDRLLKPGVTIMAIMVPMAIAFQDVKGTLSQKAINAKVNLQTVWLLKQMILTLRASVEKQLMQALKAVVDSANS